MRLRGVVSSLFAVLCQAGVGFSGTSTDLSARQSGGTLAYVQGSAPPEFTYNIDHPQSNNWIGFFKQGASPGDSYLDWAPAGDASGRAKANRNGNNCIEPQYIDAYLFTYGRRAIATSLGHYYPGNQNYQKCPGGSCQPVSKGCGCAGGRWWCQDENQCISGYKQCNGRCKADWKAVGDHCEHGCLNGQWWCQASTQCIQNTAQCNGTCVQGYYWCNKSRQCIRYSQPCSEDCGTGTWWCEVAKICIPVTDRCAGQCKTGSWWCDVAQTCVPETDQCAGKCPTGSTPSGDHCKKGCSKGHWWCESTKQCIADADQCDGKCPDGRHPVDDQCVQDLCDSTSSGVAWHYYQLAKGDGPGQIPFTPQPARIDLSLSMSGPSIPASYNGTADKVGWVDQGYLRQGTTGQLQVVRLSPNIPPNAEYLLMFWTGYLVPRSTGTYAFYTWWVDDNAYLWVGDKALSPSATNFDMYIAYASVDSFGKKSHTVNAVAGKPIPFTVLNVQSGGAFSLCFAIKENDRVVMNSCGEAGNWPIATNEVVSCPNVAFRPVFTGRS